MVVGGAALARDGDGRVVFIFGALPGELVSVRYRSVKKDFATADVMEVLEASPDRVDPPCAGWHRGCGGCDWLHVEPTAQLGLKCEIVREALLRTARVEAPVVVQGASIAPWGYRTTMRVAVAPNGRVGLRSRRSHDVVTIDRCPVAHPAIDELLSTVSASGTDELTLRVGVANNDRVVWGDAGAVVSGLMRNVEVGIGTAVHEDIAGHRFRVSAGSFFQSSPQAAELLVDAVARTLADMDLADCTVIDAYGGVGLFAATVARTAPRVVLVEASTSACADARHNLRGQRADIVETRLEKWQPIDADVVIADPARSGLDKVAAALLGATGARRIVLVSCDIGSLARDTRLLREHGFAHRGTEVLDLFPNTSHIEAVTRFDRFADSRLALDEKRSRAIIQPSRRSVEPA